MHISDLLNRNSYQSKLNTEGWRSFSAGVRSRHPYCKVCKRKDVQLQVHHTFYDKNREPWEYADHEVVVLCRACHAELHEHLQAFRRFVFGKLTPQSFKVLNGAMAVALDKYDPLVFCHALAEFVSTPTMVERYAKAWGMTAERKDP